MHRWAREADVRSRALTVVQAGGLSQVNQAQGRFQVNNHFDPNRAEISCLHPSEARAQGHDF